MTVGLGGGFGHREASRAEAQQAEQRTLVDGLRVRLIVESNPDVYRKSDSGNHVYHRATGEELAERRERDGDNYSFIPICFGDSVHSIVAKARFYSSCRQAAGAELPDIRSAHPELANTIAVIEAIKQEIQQ